MLSFAFWKEGPWEDVRYKNIQHSSSIGESAILLVTLPRIPKMSLQQKLFVEGSKNLIPLTNFSALYV